MSRRAARTIWPLIAILALLSLRASGCRKKDVAKPPGAASTHRPWSTPLMTPPPPIPTPTLWRKDITRIPTLPG